MGQGQGGRQDERRREGAVAGEGKETRPIPSMEREPSWPMQSSAKQGWLAVKKVGEGSGSSETCNSKRFRGLSSVRSFDMSSAAPLPAPNLPSTPVWSRLISRSSLSKPSQPK